MERVIRLAETLDFDPNAVINSFNVDLETCHSYIKLTGSNAIVHRLTGNNVRAQRMVPLLYGGMFTIEKIQNAVQHLRTILSGQELEDKELPYIYALKSKGAIRSCDMNNIVAQLRVAFLNNRISEDERSIIWKAFQHEPIAKQQLLPILEKLDFLDEIYIPKNEQDLELNQFILDFVPDGGFDPDEESKLALGEINKLRPEGSVTFLKKYIPLVAEFGSFKNRTITLYFLRTLDAFTNTNPETFITKVRQMGPNLSDLMNSTTFNIPDFDDFYDYNYPWGETQGDLENQEFNSREHWYTQLARKIEAYIRG